MSALANLERFGEEDLCFHKLQIMQTRFTKWMAFNAYSSTVPIEHNHNFYALTIWKDIVKCPKTHWLFKPWFNILLHTQSIVYGTVQGQCLEYLGYILFLDSRCLLVTIADSSPANVIFGKSRSLFWIS